MTQCISHEDTGLECWRWLSIGQMSYIFSGFLYSMPSHIILCFLIFQVISYCLLSHNQRFFMLVVYSYVVTNFSYSKGV